LRKEGEKEGGERENDKVVIADDAIAQLQKFRILAGNVFIWR